MMVDYATMVMLVLGVVVIIFLIIIYIGIESPPKENKKNQRAELDSKMHEIFQRENQKQHKPTNGPRDRHE